ncbi:tudor domain-containing protein 10 isoform X5 [Pongo abelii]|uniref:tudor domain-containing protein 10 isoform X5 n=1 Tax=Pongo abelii TaxID=9601 RepID=UPI0023E7FD4D|nr:tudor domain-containing protein 10 isoform X6 [Pongo abelii]
MEVRLPTQPLRQQRAPCYCQFWFVVSTDILAWMASLPLGKVLTLHYTSSDTTPIGRETGLSLCEVLEKASGEGFGKTAAIIQLAPDAPVDLCETEKLRAAFFAVPLEMRGSFLVLLLRECFRDLSWLALIHSVRGEAGLLVTSIVPKTPFFWAMHITEALHQNMQVLFSTLAQAEEQQPYLEGSAVTRGTRCLAEYHLGDYGHAWNRCWVLDRVDTWAVVMFIDFGQLATIPVQSLRSLDSDNFWTIPPLTQPFMLEKHILSSYEVVHRILKGKITGALNSELHILKFEESK